MPVDRTNIDAVITEMYAMISGKAGPRDWARQRAIFHPDARMTRTGVDENGKPWMKTMTLDGYQADTTPFFASTDFFEIEIGRETKVFGNVAHVWSAYEARNAPDDGEPERRGVNSIQLYRDDAGYWSITSMIWDNEREGVSLEAA